MSTHLHEMTYVLGIKPTMASPFNWWGAHDAGACLVKDGTITSMAEEERFSRQKHAFRPSFPTESIKYVLDDADISISDIDSIAIGRDQRRLQAIPDRPSSSLLPTDLSIDQYRQVAKNTVRVIAAKQEYPIAEVATEIEEALPGGFEGEWQQVPHHRCHAASATYCSAFNEALTFTIDAKGETDSTVIWDPELNRIRTFPKTNSLGLFYAVVGRYLGFRGHRDAGKVMGLAAHGSPRPEFEQGFDQLVSFGSGSYDVSPIIDGQDFDEQILEEQFGPRRRHAEPLTQRHKDIAFHLQQKLEEIVTHLVEYYVSQTGIQNVALAGGVAMNCKLNREIRDLDCVERLFIQPAANDSGICLGAALEGYAQHEDATPDPSLNNLYFGPQYSDTYIGDHIDRAQLDATQPKSLCAEVAELLAAGNLVGWFQGQMEFGARALGNRSILADPRSDSIRDRVNARVKDRELWRPFAPSIKEESTEEYLKHGNQARFMILLDEVRDSKVDEIPAVTHVDQTTRPQTVTRSTNERYYRLLDEFEAITGTPVLLNTSFNTSGEPIVESPEQAIADFYNTGLDVLAIGDYLLTKPHT